MDEQPWYNSSGDNSSSKDDSFTILNPKNIIIDQFSRQALGSVSNAYLSPVKNNYKSYISFLKKYFHVNNRYVLLKILFILFPFPKIRQERLDESRYDQVAANNNVYGFRDVEEEEEENGNAFSRTRPYKPKKIDIYRPDLYIPIMSFATFTLLGVALLLKQETMSELFGNNLFWSLLICLIEVVSVKGILFFLSSPSSVGIMKLICLSFYKYCSFVVILIVTALFGVYGYWLILFYTISAMVIFVQLNLSETFVTSEGRIQFDPKISKRRYALLILSLCQIPIFFFFTWKYRNTGPLLSLFGGPFSQQDNNNNNIPSFQQQQQGENNIMENNNMNIN